MLSTLTVDIDLDVFQPGAKSNQVLRCATIHPMCYDSFYANYAGMRPKFDSPLRLCLQNRMPSLIWRIPWKQRHSFCSRKPGGGMGVHASLCLGLGPSGRQRRPHSLSRRLHFSFAAPVAGWSEAFHGRGGEMAERGLVPTPAARSCGAGGLGAGTT